MSNRDVNAQRIPELSGEDEHDIATRSMAPNVTYTAIPPPSQSLPELTEEWFWIPGKGSLPSQPPYQITPKATTQVRNSVPRGQGREGETRSDGRNVEVEQCYSNARRYAETSEMSGQHSSADGDDIASTLATRVSASEISISAGTQIEHISICTDGLRSHPTLASSSSPLSSPRPTEQTCQRASPTNALSPTHLARVAATTTPVATTNGQCKQARIDAVDPVSSYRRLGAEEFVNPRKRLYRESSVGEDTKVDGDGAGTTKRVKLRAGHDSAPACQANQLSSVREDLGNMTPKKVFRQPPTRVLAQTTRAYERELASSRARRDPMSRDRDSGSALDPTLNGKAGDESLEMDAPGRPKRSGFSKVEVILRSSLSKTQREEVQIISEPKSESNHNLHDRRRSPNIWPRSTQCVALQALPKAEASKRPECNRIGGSQTTNRTTPTGSSSASEETLTDACSACGFSA
jgi:hypothetical protein